MPSSDPKLAPRIAVIGGGLSGLAAAHRLTQLLPAADIRLFEASSRLGGSLLTVQRDGVVYEQGADSFLTRDSLPLELVQELGLHGEILPTNHAHRRALVVSQGRLLPVPEGFVLMQPRQLLSLMHSPVLSDLGKLRAVAEPSVARNADVDRADYDESVASFATRRLGREAFERLVEPLVAGIFTADATKLSLAATYPEFIAAEREHGSLWRAWRERKPKAAPTASGAASPLPNLVLRKDHRLRSVAAGDPARRSTQEDAARACTPSRNEATVNSQGREPLGPTPEVIETEPHRGESRTASEPSPREGLQLHTHRQGEANILTDAMESGARYGAFVTLRGGLGRLIEVLAASVQPRALPGGPAKHLEDCTLALNHRVTAVESLPGARWRVTAANGRSDGLCSEEFDGLIITLPARHAAALLRGVDEPLSDSLARIQAASSVVATLLYRAEQVTRPLDGFGLVVPRIENRPIIAASFPSVKFPGRSPAGLVPIRVFLGGALRPDMIDRDDSDLLAIAHQELADLMGAHGDPALTFVTRWREAMPQYHVGHVALVDAIEARVAALPRLQLAGNSYRGVGIPQCLHSARTAAERLASAMATGTSAPGSARG